MSPEKPIIVISSCLLGECVRYNGEHRLDFKLRDECGPQVHWIPLCPEKECGLGVPREAMNLVQTSSGVRLVTGTTKHDLTERMLFWTGLKIKELKEQKVRGCILKSRSPSCGVCDTPVFAPEGEMLRKGPGLFTEMIHKELPRIPIVDSDQMRNPVHSRAFLDQIGKS